MPCTYYTVCPDERIHHTEVNYAVEDYLDCLLTQDWPDTVTVLAYRRKQIDDACRKQFTERLTDHIMEMFGEEFGDPDAYEQPGKDVQELLKQAVDRFADDYDVWMMEEVPEENVEVDVAKWVRTNAPRWMNDADVALFMASNT